MSDSFPKEAETEVVSGSPILYPRTPFVAGIFLCHRGWGCVCRSLEF